MTRVLKTILSVFFIAAMAIQLSGQCAHTATNVAGIPATQGVGVGFGQSFQADCINDEFTDITFSFKNFNNAVWTVELFDGQSDDPADLLYSQSGVVPTMGAANPNSNGGVFYTAILGGGTGSLAYTQGQTYTFICTLESGSHAVEFGFGDQYLAGAQYYSNTSFTSEDNHFEFGSGPSSAVADCNIEQPNANPQGNTHPTLNIFGQSFTGTCLDAGQFSSLKFIRSRETANGQAPERTATLNIYSGDGTGGTPVYTQTGVVIPAPANTSENYYEIDIAIGGGTGDLSYTPGQQYTWELVSNGLVRPSSWNNTSYTGGQAYWENVPRANDDFEFYLTVSGSTTAAVPTMGEWALIILALIIMSMGVVTVMRWQSVQNLQTAGGNVQMSLNTGNSLPFNKKSYFQILPFVWGGLVAVFAVSMAFFGYELTSADIPGALMAGAVGTYLIHLIRR